PKSEAKADTGAANETTSSKPEKKRVKAEKTTTTLAEYRPKVPKTQAELRALQRQLAIYGYRPGIVDGLMGDKTREAVKRLQREHGLPETGWLSGETLQALAKPKHYSGTFAEPKEVKFADHPRDEKTYKATW